MIANGSAVARVNVGRFRECPRHPNDEHAEGNPISEPKRTRDEAGEDHASDIPQPAVWRPLLT
jgi:hypothetical protein